MFILRGDFGCFLYTGDFRWECNDDADNEARTTLVAAINDFPVDILYLDNTYCNPIYTFPPRQLAANLIADIIISHPSHDIVIGVDSLGKEELLVHVSRILNIKVFVFLLHSLVICALHCVIDPFVFLDLGLARATPYHAPPWFPRHFHH